MKLLVDHTRRMVARCTQVYRGHDVSRLYRESGEYILEWNIKVRDVWVEVSEEEYLMYTIDGYTDAFNTFMKY